MVIFRRKLVYLRKGAINHTRFLDLSHFGPGLGFQPFVGFDPKWSARLKLYVNIGLFFYSI